MIRVALVDDDALVRAGLRLILGGADDVEVVAEAADGLDALRVLRSTPVDVVLMDIRMPRMDGLSATAELERAPSAPHVIVLTTFDADDYVLRALRHGASGFLLKDTAPEVLVDAVRKVAAGDPMLSPSVTEQLIRRVRDLGDGDGDAKERLAVLSEREREVAVAVGRGMSNAEIAVDLHMSLATAKAHVSRILTKLDAANRVQVAIAVHEAGLV
ncbi:response regulator transcription factor [Mumia sp. zg.B53]|uniref:response regulator transcription factor n=1 Tax=unclassified Mumia TaxID=2621872 RepID=UPI001C6EFA58|nr:MULTISPECIES: response regulator transcription factor [unclassified Mumia]MBW9205504.1 response regulator transcription factor [Mumia sp. zg.B17]MBW9208495.1 response regulator transcription factor [Mumia sp. zg.B21]MBW9216453.1 response regulator transcription factor [Mumia sp. zg.B53]MDD9349560.1 response regulator transcription factor [Mumia sp.]